MPNYDVTITVPETILLTYEVQLNAPDEDAAIAMARALVEDEQTSDPDEEALGRDFSRLTARATERP